MYNGGDPLILGSSGIRAHFITLHSRRKNSRVSFDSQLASLIVVSNFSLLFWYYLDFFFFFFLSII